MDRRSDGTLRQTLPRNDFAKRLGGSGRSCQALPRLPRENGSRSIIKPVKISSEEELRVKEELKECNRQQLAAMREASKPSRTMLPNDRQKLLEDLKAITG